MRNPRRVRSRKLEQLWRICGVTCVAQMLAPFAASRFWLVDRQHRVGGSQVRIYLGHLYRILLLLNSLGMGMTLR
jgi:hypothetical protein